MTKGVRITSRGFILSALYGSIATNSLDVITFMTVIQKVCLV